MGIYEKYCNDRDINKILDTVNDINKGIITGCHGRYHVMFVVDMVEHILGSLSYDARTVALGKIAALMHDIGNVAGRRNHAQKSAALAAVFLGDSHDLSLEEKNVIVQAVADHSEGENISSAVGAALLIADKVDLSCKRILPVDNIDDWHKNLLEIRDVEVRVAGDEIAVNYIATDAFLADALIGKYTEVPTKAARYLGLACQILVNGRHAV